jgi:hypothetical protein
MYKHRGPKYQTGFISEINRKVLFKPVLIIHELKLDSSIVSKTGGSSNTDTVNYKLVMDNAELRLRFMNLLYIQGDTAIVCKLIRSLYLEEFKNSPLSSTCIASTNLIIDIDKLLPSEFTPTNILLFGSNDKLLKDKFPGVNITKFDKKDKTGKYDFIIVDNVLHQNRSIIDVIISSMETNSYLFIREFDIEDSDDEVLLSTTYNILSNPVRYTYIPKTSLPNLFPKLELHSESYNKLDYMKNPAKQYYMLFTKV